MPGAHMSPFLDLWIYHSFCLRLIMCLSSGSMKTVPSWRNPTLISLNTGTLFLFFYSIMEPFNQFYCWLLLLFDMTVGTWGSICWDSTLDIFCPLCEYLPLLSPLIHFYCAFLMVQIQEENRFVPWEFAQLWWAIMGLYNGRFKLAFIMQCYPYWF